MPDTVRTKGQLTTLFADNMSGLITAQDGRDEIVSSFGYPSSSDPTVNNDSADTAGIGEFFDVGSKWQNTSTFHSWVCYAGPAGAAIWRQLANLGDIPAPGVTSVGLSMPGGFDVAGSPVTSSGTLAVTAGNEPANVFAAGPTSGPPAPWTWRGLVVADIPGLPATIITSGPFNVTLIPSLPASQITSGTFSPSLIPGLPASQITSGTFSPSQIPSLDASIITTGTFLVGLIPGLPGSIITSGTISATYLPASVQYQQGVHGSGTSTAANVSLFTASDSNGLYVQGAIKNTGGVNGIAYTVTVTDWLGVNGTVGPALISPGQTQFFKYSTSDLLGAAVSPIVSVTVQIKDNSPGNHSNYSYTFNAW